MRRSVIVGLIALLFTGTAYGGQGQASEELGTGALSAKKQTMIRPVGPLNMSQGVIVPKGRYVIRLQYAYTHKGNLYDGSDKKTGNYTGKYDQVNQSAVLVFKAGLFENIEARLVVPYRDKELKQKSGNPPKHTNTAENSGLGDIKMMGRYSLMDQRKGDWLHMLIGAGVKLPTGDSDKKNVAPFSKEHQYMGSGFQLGSGSWDPVFEIGMTKFVGRSRFDFHTMYTITTKGDHGCQLGDLFKCDFGFSYALNRYFDVELEMNNLYQGAQVHDHQRTVNTGGYTLYMTPGLHWKIYRQMDLRVGVPIVVYRNLNGESAKPDWKSKYGLGEDYKIVARLCFKF
jgi:hypothetical protein